MFDSKQHTRLSPEVGSKWVQNYKKKMNNQISILKYVEKLIFG
jgi:hypothetical protein